MEDLAKEVEEDWASLIADQAYKRAWKKLRRWLKKADLENVMSPTDAISITMDKILKAERRR